MTFGKHIDKDLVDIPLEYLIWMEQQKITDDIRKGLNFEIERRNSTTTSQGRDVQLLTKPECSMLRRYHNFLVENCSEPYIKAKLDILHREYIGKFEII